MNRRALGLRQAVPAAAMAAALLWGTVPVASAGDEWCESDPLVLVQTPGGHVVPVHVTNYAQGREHQAAVDAACIETHAEATNGGRATLVTILVIVPGDGSSSTFRTRSVTSSGLSGTGTVYATASGHSSKAMLMRFVLNVT